MIDDYFDAIALFICSLVIMFMQITFLIEHKLLYNNLELLFISTGISLLNIYLCKKIVEFIYNKYNSGEQQ